MVFIFGMLHFLGTYLLLPSVCNMPYHSPIAIQITPNTHYNSEMKIILTGGTFLKEYDAQDGIVDGTGHLFREFLDDLLLYDTPDVVPWCGMKDSLDITKKDRKDIWKLCKKQKDNRLLIVHGTDTMNETHRYFSKKQPLGTVVFTGSLFPLCIRNTEAEFNLGFALACAKTLPKGNYVAMNGEIFVNDVWKDYEELCFKGRTWKEESAGSVGKTTDFT